MKKSFLVLLAAIFMISGCSQKKNIDYSNGPVVNEQTLSDAELELQLIQTCIDDYNNDRIAEREEYYGIDIAPLPINIDSIPEVTSLNQLDISKEQSENSNADFVATLAIDDQYSIQFTLYHITESDFWLNGTSSFLINTETAVKDDSAFSAYKSELDRLLADETDILNWMYGMDVTLSETEGPIAGYYEVLSIGTSDIHSIDELKAFAETVFPKSYLESSYYPSAFDTDSAIYKEADGILYCAASGFYPEDPTSIYDTDYIAAASDDGTSVSIDILKKVMDQVQPELHRIVLIHADNGYLLSTAY